MVTWVNCSAALNADPVVCPSLFYFQQFVW